MVGLKPRCAQHARAHPGRQPSEGSCWGEWSRGVSKSGSAAPASLAGSLGEGYALCVCVITVYMNTAS